MDVSPSTCRPRRLGQKESYYNGSFYFFTLSCVEADSVSTRGPMPARTSRKLFATAVDDVFGSHFLHTERSLDVGRPTRSASMPVPSVGGPACDPVDDDETYQECPTSG
ncbi:hypothetical protein DCS_07955 [Drechmeria coniospora]|uniref:Uncharacterized protein n=1 Tax=Drechmeria coniospora TaxID=98403 RepID=A0A151GFW1_DRECN|nr:hypothetical protein DCS_07955 [Drechmeria coniospora]KYK55990.1 hypothetical protein DCS_07955 [Drechmeria coniospora]